MKYVVTALISARAPFLPAHHLVLVPRGTPSPPSVQAGPALSSGTRCRHSASAGEAEKKVVAQKRFYQAEAEHRISTLYYVTSPGFRTKTPSDTEWSQNVCSAEIM